MIRNALVSVVTLITAMLFSFPAQAHRTETEDDSVAILADAPPLPLSPGMGSGFGGQLGGDGSAGRSVSIAWDSDVLGGLSLRMRGAACGAEDQDVIVFYLDSVFGTGFADTSAFDDDASLESRAVSASSGSGTWSSQLTFGGGVEVDYAIALTNTPTGSTAYLYQLVAGGSHVARALTVSRPATGSCQDVTISGLSEAEIGTPVGGIFAWVATLLNAQNGFRSNEFHGVMGPDTNIGVAPYVLGAHDLNTFTTIGPIVINEVDTQTPGSPDAAEFIELYGPANARLDGATLVMFNGASDLSYNLGGHSGGIDLDGQTLSATGFWVAGNSAIGVSGITFGDGTLQQGADAVALYLGDGTDFPAGTAVTGTDVIDALVYDTGQSDDTELLNALTPGQGQINEGIAFPADLGSNQRCDDGAGGPRITTAYRQGAPSPALINPCALCGDGIVEDGEDCDIGGANGAAYSCCASDCSFQGTSAPCAPLSGQACDAVNTCDGAGTCVPRVQAEGFTCRAVLAGGCDVAEVCDGTNAACPSDAVEAMGTECRAANTNGCDAAETCDGASAACPADGVLAMGVECRAALGGGCDVAEACDGASDTCPSDIVAEDTTMCRAALAGGCDLTEFCDGMNVACPADTVAGAGIECRAALTGGCDVAESCDGTSAACPADAIASPGTVCREANASGCDAAESCTGASTTCPSDGFVADDTACVDAMVCDGSESCQSGVCTAGTSLDCDDSDLCTADACAEPGGCANVEIAGCCNIDTDCDDGDVCTADVCSGPGGTCSQSPISGCCVADADCDDSNLCTTNTCDTGANECQSAPVSGCCASDSDCDDSDACSTDTCNVATGECGNAAIEGCCLSAGDCGDDDTCTTDTCESMICGNDPLAGCCVADTDCDDGDECTVDSCDVGTAACGHAPLAGCGSDAGPNEADASVEPGPDGSPTELDAGVDSGVDGGMDTMTDGGCGCRTAGASGEGSTGGWFSLLGLLGLVFWRRRRTLRRVDVD